MKKRKVTSLLSWKSQARKLPGQVTCGPSLHSPEHNGRPLAWEARRVGGRIVGQFVRNPKKPGQGKGWVEKVTIKEAS